MNLITVILKKNANFLRPKLFFYVYDTKTNKCFLFINVNFKIMSKKIKETVKEKYAQIVEQIQNFGCGCGSNFTFPDGSKDFSKDYSKLQGYEKNADYNLGCGIPTGFIEIKEGDTVVDLGSGAGNDVFVARRLVGETGRVIGIDMTQAMIDKANLNNKKLAYKNVEFKLGDIENIPVENNTSDFVISNCVMNLVPDKEKAFSEEEKKYILPENLVKQFLSQDEYELYRNSNAEIFSITVKGGKDE